MDLILAGTLVAVNTEERSISYRLLPYGEPGRTSRGTVTPRRGCLTWDDPTAIVLNLEHDRTRPAARCAELTDTPAALLVGP